MEKASHKSGFRYQVLKKKVPNDGRNMAKTLVPVMTLIATTFTRRRHTIPETLPQARIATVIRSLDPILSPV